MTVITLDGPAGSGKTVCGRLAALRIGVDFLSSGLYFRAVSYQALKEGMDLEEGEGLLELSDRVEVSFKNAEEALYVFVEGEDRTFELKDPELTCRVRFVADNPLVRNRLARRMREFSGPRGLLAEGRDMGSVVFPDAQTKIFLDAGLDCRVERRNKELLSLGSNVSGERLREELEARDQRDRTRMVSPLVVPDGALIVDSSDLTIDQVVERILQGAGYGSRSQE